MAATPVVGNGSLDAVRVLVDGVLDGYLRECAADLGRVDPAATMLVDEISRLVFAGGKRLRPAFCVWGYRAAVGTPGLSIPGGPRRAISPITRSCVRRRPWSCCTRWP